MLRNLLMQKQGQQSNDLAEVYAYADSIGVTPQQVDSAIGNNTALRERLIAWKYLLHSLIDTGYTPWIVGNKISYINTHVVPAQGYAMEINVKETTDRRTLVGSRASATKSCFLFGYVEDKTKLHCGYGGEQSLVNTSVQLLRLKHKIKLSPSVNNHTAELYIDDAKVADLTIGELDNAKEIYLFAWNQNDVAIGSQLSVANINYLKIWSGYLNNQEKILHFVPYCDNGTYGMLDLVTGTFYGSAVPNGLFTYVLEDSNGNQVNIN